MTARVIERLQLEMSLRRAVDNEELIVFYQSQVDIASGRLIGAEALVRWQHHPVSYTHLDVYKRQVLTQATA